MPTPVAFAFCILSRTSGCAEGLGSAPRFASAIPVSILLLSQGHHLSTEIISGGLVGNLSVLEGNSGGSYRLKRGLVSFETWVRAFRYVASCLLIRASQELSGASQWASGVSQWALGSTDMAWRKNMHGLPSALAALPPAAVPYNSRHGQVSVDRGLPVSCGVGCWVWVMAGCRREIPVGVAP